MSAQQSSPLAQQMYNELRETMIQEGIGGPFGPTPEQVRAIMDTISDAIGTGAIWERVGNLDGDSYRLDDYREAIVEAFDFDRVGVDASPRPERVA